MVPFFHLGSPVTLSEVVCVLRAEGLPAEPHRIDYALRTHKLPEPPRDGAGNRDFTAADVGRLRQYLSQPLGRGRPPRARARLEAVS